MVSKTWPVAPEELIKFYLKMCDDGSVHTCQLFLANIFGLLPHGYPISAPVDSFQSQKENLRTVHVFYRASKTSVYSDLPTYCAKTVKQELGDPDLSQT